MIGRKRRFPARSSGRKSNVLEEHTLPQPVFGLGFIRRSVGFLLSADKGANFFNALCAAGGKHFRHLDDPVALQLLEHPVIVQLFQVIGKPLVPDCQQAEESGLPGTLAAYQTKHFLIFGTGTEYPADSAQQEVFQHFFHIVAFISAKKVVQAGTDAGCPVPDKAVQHILNRVIAIFVCYNGKCSCDLFLTGQLVVLLKIEEKIFHIGIC